MLERLSLTFGLPEARRHQPARRAATAGVACALAAASLVVLGCSAGSPSPRGAGSASGAGGSSGSSSGGASGSSSGSSGGGASGASGASGVAGSAGASGSAGSSGAAGASGNGGNGGATATCDIGGKILCEDFDAIAAGSLPSGAPWLTRDCFAGGYTLQVDEGAHHSGVRSLLGENIPYADCELLADMGASLSEYWVRAWVYYGQAAPTAATHEVSVFELVPAGSNATRPGTTDDPSIRVGYRGDTCLPIGVEVNITGGGQEETGCTGSMPAQDTWYCYVLHVTQTASAVTADLAIDGVDQSYMNHGVAQTEITSQVAGVRYLRLGTRSFSGNWANPIYVDDVAVATQPIPCN